MRPPVRTLTVEEQTALDRLTPTWQGPDDLLVKHATVHSLFLLGLAERTAIRVGRRWENQYRLAAASTRGGAA